MIVWFWVGSSFEDFLKFGGTIDGLIVITKGIVDLGCLCRIRFLLHVDLE